jgi:phage pi2 protein 07
MEDLKRCIKQYREVDDQLRELNRQVYWKRDMRKLVESEITEIIKTPEFQNFKKVKVEEDGSTITIKRPNEWTKPWSLSQKELKELLNQYFAVSGNNNADELFKYIIETKKQALVSGDYSISRTVPGENED